MKKLLLLLIIVSGFMPAAFSCTTFFINNNGQMIFGRNYDWVTGNGMVCINQKGLSKTSIKTTDGEAINWVALYGSITFNQYGKEFPTGGMNEKGLVVELMWLDGTVYPSADERPAVGELQWIQYQLDNCSSVDEIIATDKKLRIASKGTTPLHYLVADGKGSVATIEFMNGKILVHKGSDLPFPVLTNSSYAESVLQTSTAIASGNPAISFPDNSLNRFAKACTMIRQFQQTNITTPIIDYSFDILAKVAQGDHTKWSIVYDISNKKIYFKTYGYPQVKNMAFSAFYLNCSVISKAWDMNQPVTGDITKLFDTFSLELNRRIVERSFDESSSQFSASSEERKQTWEYPGGISCKN